MQSALTILSVLLVGLSVTAQTSIEDAQKNVCIDQIKAGYKVYSTAINLDIASETMKRIVSQLTPDEARIVREQAKRHEELASLDLQLQLLDKKYADSRDDDEKLTLATQILEKRNGMKRNNQDVAANRALTAPIFQKLAAVAVGLKSGAQIDAKVVEYLTADGSKLKLTFPIPKAQQIQFTTHGGYFDSPNFFPKEFSVSISAIQGIDSPEVLISGTNGLNGDAMNVADFMSHYLSPPSCYVSADKLRASLK